MVAISAGQDTSGGFDPDVDTPSKVYVNGERIPVGNVDIHIRNEGGLSTTRYAEVYFYSPVFGIDWIEYFDTANPDTQTDWDVLRIDVKDRATGEYNTEFVGLVTGLGNSANDHEKEFLARARGPGHLLDRVRASKVFRNSSPEDVLDYVETTIEDKLPVPVDVVADEGEMQEDSITPSTSDKGRDLGYSISSKTFQRNRDSLSDVANWLMGHVDARISFVPHEEGVTLKMTQESNGAHHDAHYLDGDLVIVNNNALNEILPINTAVVRGEAKQSLIQVGDFNINAPSNQYHAVKVRHRPLYERAGEREYAKTDIEIDAHTAEEVRSGAKDRLGRQIAKATAGEIESLLRSPIAPFDTVEAKPTCDTTQASDTVPVTYEVRRVHHQIRADDMPITRLNVGVHADTEEMEIINSWEKSA